MSKPGDPRLCEIVRPGLEGDVVLLGYPVDEGVRRNGGRVGSAHGPAVAREFLRAFGTLINPEYNVDLSALRVGDGGDAAAAGSADQEQAVASLAALVAGVLRKGGVPFSIGGGNDQSYGSYLGFREAMPGKSLGVVNIDAHLDVRPLLDGRAHSGSPFRQMLDTPGFTGTYLVYGAQGSQCSAAHTAFVQERGGRVVWLRELGGECVAAFSGVLQELAGRCDHIFFSFDLDAIRGADAPGVSCSSALGLTAADALEMCRVAGEHPKVSLCDLSEFNPVVERHRTGRLVAQMFYYFLLGFARRPKL